MMTWEEILTVFRDTITPGKWEFGIGYANDHEIEMSCGVCFGTARLPLVAATPSTLAEFIRTFDEEHAATCAGGIEACRAFRRALADRAPVATTSEEAIRLMRLMGGELPSRDRGPAKA